MIEEFVLCDTGFIIALADEDDKFHPDARFFFEESSMRFLLPISVLVEAFHLLRKKRERSSFLFEEVCDPGQFKLIDDMCGLYEEAIRVHRRFVDLDLVDCLLLTYAVQLAQMNGRAVPYLIVTTDGRMTGLAYHISEQYSFRALIEA